MRTASATSPSAATSSASAVSVVAFDGLLAQALVEAAAQPRHLHPLLRGQAAPGRLVEQANHRVPLAQLDGEVRRAQQALGPRSGDPRSARRPATARRPPPRRRRGARPGPPPRPASAATDSSGSAVAAAWCLIRRSSWPGWQDLSQRRVRGALVGGRSSTGGWPSASAGGRSAPRCPPRRPASRSPPVSRSARTDLCSGPDPRRRDDLAERRRCRSPPPCAAASLVGPGRVASRSVKARSSRSVSGSRARGTC